MDSNDTKQNTAGKTHSGSHKTPTKADAAPNKKEPSTEPQRSGSLPKASAEIDTKELPYDVRISEPAVNIRRGPGTNFPVVGVIKDWRKLTIAEEREGFSGKEGSDPKSLWGKLKSEPGWILLSLTEPA